MAKKSRLGSRFKNYTPPKKNDVVLQDLQKTVDTVDIEYVDPKRLQIHPQNKNYYGELSGEGYEALKADIKRAGEVLKAIEISALSNLVIAGNRRLQAAIELNLPHVPIIRRTFESEEEELDYLIKDNILQRHLTQKDFEAIIAQRFGKRINTAKRGGDRQSDNFKAQKSERLDQEIARRIGIPESTVRKCLSAIRKQKEGKAKQKKQPEKLEQFEKKVLSWQKSFEKFSFSEDERGRAIKLLQDMLKTLKQQNK